MTLNDFMIITGLTLNHTASLDLPKTMSHCTLGTYLNSSEALSLRQRNFMCQLSQKKMLQFSMHDITATKFVHHLTFDLSPYALSFPNCKLRLAQ